MAFLTAFLQLIHCQGQRKWPFFSSVNNSMRNLYLQRACLSAWYELFHLGLNDGFSGSMGMQRKAGWAVFRQTSSHPPPINWMQIRVIIWVFRQNCLCPPNNLDMCQSEWYWNHPSKEYSMQSSLCQLEPASHDFSPPLGKCWGFHYLWYFWAKLSSGRNQNSFIKVTGTIPSFFSWKSSHSPECLKTGTVTVLHTQWWEELEEKSAECSLLLNRN